MHCSYFAPPCFLAKTRCLLSVNFLSFLNLQMDGCLYKQHSWLLCQLQTNANSFFRALCFSSLRPLWKAWEVCVCSNALTLLQAYKLHFNWPAIFRMDCTCICAAYFHFTLITWISQSNTDKHNDEINTKYTVSFSENALYVFLLSKSFSFNEPPPIA